MTEFPTNRATRAAKSHPTHQYDVIIIGAGAAGMMCAMEAGRRGRRVLLLDHAAKAGEKIRISGGGRCNFTNLHASPAAYLSANPSFCRSALKGYRQQDFIALVQRHGIAFHEKTLGQLFCDGSSQQIIDMLLKECREAGVTLRLNATIGSVQRQEGGGFKVETPLGTLQTNALVVACGGLSIPKMGATGLGYQLARQFGHRIIETRPGLVPFTLTEAELQRLQGLSGVAVEATAEAGRTSFAEGVLFTHRGLSGPAILQISSYWQPGESIRLNLAPSVTMQAALLEAKTHHSRQEAATVLSHHLPRRLAQTIAAPYGGRLAELSNKRLAELAAAVNRWEVTPNGTEGYRTSEVTLGGVDTRELSSKTMESTIVPGLFFIGEVVDVTGHLGGYNFQWAWSSGYAAGRAA